jgi:hypothetical protein
MNNYYGSIFLVLFWRKFEMMRSSWLEDKDTMTKKASNRLFYFERILFVRGCKIFIGCKYVFGCNYETEPNIYKPERL